MTQREIIENYLSKTKNGEWVKEGLIRIDGYGSMWSGACQDGNHKTCAYRPCLCTCHAKVSEGKEKFCNKCGGYSDKPATNCCSCNTCHIIVAGIPTPPKAQEEKQLPCPHGRASWRMCPHCLGINSVPTPPKEEAWEKEFDKKFPDITHTSCADKTLKCGTMANDVKSFIKSLLASERAKVREMVGGMKNKNFDDFEKEKSNAPELKVAVYAGYNLALSDLLEKLKE